MFMLPAVAILTIAVSASPATTLLAVRSSPIYTARDSDPTITHKQPPGADLVLTDTLVKRYSEIEKALTAFWKTSPGQADEQLALKRGDVSGVAGDSALAAFFAEHHYPPAEYGAVRHSVINAAVADMLAKNGVDMGLGHFGSNLPIVEANVAFIHTHEQEMKEAGLDITAVHTGTKVTPRRNPN